MVTSLLAFFYSFCLLSFRVAWKRSNRSHMQYPDTLRMQHVRSVTALKIFELFLIFHTATFVSMNADVAWRVWKDMHNCLQRDKWGYRPTTWRSTQIGAQKNWNLYVISIERRFNRSPFAIVLSAFECNGIQKLSVVAGAMKEVRWTSWNSKCRHLNIEIYNVPLPCRSNTPKNRSRSCMMDIPCNFSYL